MSGSIPVSFEFNGENLISVEFPDEQVTATLELSPMGSQLYRIRSVPIMIEAASFGDIIEAVPGSDGSLRFVRVAERGGWRTYDFLLSTELMESKRITAVQEHVLSLGGHWEQVFGGVLLLCLPPTTDYDPTEDIQRET